MWKIVRQTGAVICPLIEKRARGSGKSVERRKKGQRTRAVIEESPSARGGKEVWRWFGTGTLGVATNDDAPTR